MEPLALAVDLVRARALDRQRVGAGGRERRALVLAPAAAELGELGALALLGVGRRVERGREAGTREGRDGGGRRGVCGAQLVRPWQRVVKVLGLQLGRQRHALERRHGQRQELEQLGHLVRHLELVPQSLGSGFGGGASVQHVAHELQRVEVEQGAISSSCCC